MVQRQGVSCSAAAVHRCGPPSAGVVGCCAAVRQCTSAVCCVLCAVVTRQGSGQELNWAATRPRNRPSAEQLRTRPRFAPRAPAQPAQVLPGLHPPQVPLPASPSSCLRGCVRCTGLACAQQAAACGPECDKLQICLPASCLNNPAQASQSMCSPSKPSQELPDAPQPTPPHQVHQHSRKNLSHVVGGWAAER